MQIISTLTRNVLSPWFLIFFGLVGAMIFVFYLFQQKKSGWLKILPYNSTNQVVENPPHWGQNSSTRDATLSHSAQVTPSSPPSLSSSVNRSHDLSPSVSRSHDLLACSYSTNPIKDPIVLANGDILNRDQLDSFLSSTTVRFGIRSSIGNLDKKWYCADLSQVHTRSHKNLHAIQAWIQSQESYQHPLIWENPCFILTTIGYDLIKQNIRFLLPSPVPDGFLEKWYDENCLFKDPVINVQGETVEFPQAYRGILQYCPYHQVEVVKVECLEGQDKVYWVKTPLDNRVRDAREIFDFSKCQSLTADSLFTQFYPDTFTVNFVKIAKEHLAEYAKDCQLQVPGGNRLL